jgi:hypothetical protein
VRKEDPSRGRKNAVEEWLAAWWEHPECLIHPLDEKFLESECENLYAPSLTRCEDLETRTGQFRKELGAMPFVGNIRTASIFLLMINPGVSCKDYTDRLNEETQRLFAANKRQEKCETCFALKPGGPCGWEPYYRRRVFGALLSEYGTRAEDAREFLAERLAILELVPYYSQKARLIKTRKLHQRLPTTLLARRAACELASDPHNLVITRWLGEEWWGLEGTVQSRCRNGLSEDAKNALRERINDHLGLPVNRV